jgi:alpha-tubulin suppressor-like RCC1 family protein/fibronectin type 3 domain-containing protein
MKKFLLFLALCLMICGCLFTTQGDAIFAASQTTPQVQGGYGHSLGLKDDGSVWAWGNNNYGQLGDGTNTSTATPKKLETISNVKTIAVGYYHNLALKTDGTVWAWGQNNGYQLGDGTTTNRNIPVLVPGVGNVKAIAAGESHSLALKEDGTVWAWGTNYSGQLGDGTSISRSTPGVVPGLTGVTAIAASKDYSFALKSDGTLWGWGYNSYGQLGVGTIENKYTPTQVSGLSGVTAMACGYVNVYALTNDGSLWAWGYNSNGELGLGYALENIYPNYISTPTKIPALSNVTAITARGLFAVAQKDDGTIWAWGKNDDGQVGDGTNVNKTSPVQISGLDNVFSTGCGIYHTVVIKNNGSVWLWGNNSYGQLGDGSNIGKNAPIQLPNFFMISDPMNLIATAGDCKIVLQWSGQLDAIYYNVKRAGTAGGPYMIIASNINTATYADTTVANGTTYYYIVTAVTINGERSTLREVSATPCKPANAPQLTGGYSHSLTVMADGTVWVWGDNSYGQLGDYTKLNTRTCERLEYFDNVQAVAASEYHSVALKMDGTVWAWGQNNYGQLGDGSTLQRCAPVQVTGINDVKKITTGKYFSVALKTDGTVWAWGSNTFGQLGDGTTTGRITPVQVLGLANIVSIAAGDEFVFAIQDDGTLWAWGRNEDRVICGSTSSYEAAPIQVTSIAGVKSVACGCNAVYVLKLDGTLWAWGAGSFGQIGNGTNSYITSTPVQVSGLNNVSAVSAGACYAVALLSDGTLRAWGRNDYGQIGDGTTVDKNIPTLVTGLDNICAIGCGYFHTLAYKNDGSLFSWGENSAGQLGNGTNTRGLTPGRVPNAGLLSLPADPRNLTAIAGNAKVVLSWNIATGAASYNVKRAQTAGGPYTTIVSIPSVTATAFTDTAVTNDVTYYYTVTSVNRDGESVGTNEVSATPNANKPLAPANPATESGYAKVILRWDPVAGAYTYNVKRSQFSGGPYTTIASNLSQNTFTDTGLTNGIRYYYIVTAVNDNGEGPGSAEISAIPLVPAPANLTVTAGNRKVTLRWTKGDGVTWTRIKRATIHGGPYTSLMSTTGSSYDDTDVTIETTYYYIVVNTINGEESASSNEVSAAPYAAPYNLTATAGSGMVNLSWGSATVSSYYNVKRSNTSGGPYVTLISNLAGTTYSDTTAVNGTSYYYVVTTISAGAERFSNEVSATPNYSDNYEPNDSMSSAYSISKNITITSLISSSTDVDYFKVVISSTSSCTITLTPPSGKDYDLYLLNSSGTQIGSSTNGTGSVDTIAKSLAAGTYYIKVKGYNGAYSTTTAYTLKVTSN